MERLKILIADDEEKIGYFSNSEYISQFKKEYANQHDLSLLLIRFNTEDEFNDTLRAFTQKQCDLMYVDARLREAYKILSYLALTVWLWTESREQEDLDWQVTQAIRSFL